MTIKQTLTSAVLEIVMNYISKSPEKNFSKLLGIMESIPYQLLSSKLLM